MPFRIKHGDHDVVDALRRIADEQFGKAIAGLEGDLPLPEAVHDTRKRLKKVRGLLRLVRPGFPDYSRENRVLRDAGRRLSGLRDAHVLIETLDRLLAGHDDPLDADSFLPLRQRLVGEREAAEGGEGRSEDVEAVRDVLDHARRRAGGWVLTETGFAAVAGGTGKIYKAARRGTGLRPGKAADDEVHAWRKAVKYHGYHVRLLRDLWRLEMKTRREATDALGDLLGDYQDLRVFVARVETEPVPEAARRVLAGLAERRKAELLTEAQPLAGRLFADKPKALRHRWGTWWEVWRG